MRKSRPSKYAKNAQKKNPTIIVCLSPFPLCCSAATPVQGGDDPSRPESYHPLYITDNPEGGYGRKRSNERRIETVFAGMDGVGNGHGGGGGGGGGVGGVGVGVGAGVGVLSGSPGRATGVGPLCEYVTRDGGSADGKAAESETFEVRQGCHADVACLFFVATSGCVVKLDLVAL